MNNLQRKITQYSTKKQDLIIYSGLFGFAIILLGSYFIFDFSNDKSLLFGIIYVLFALLWVFFIVPPENEEELSEETIKEIKEARENQDFITEDEARKILFNRVEKEENR